VHSAQALPRRRTDSSTAAAWHRRLGTIQLNTAKMENIQMDTTVMGSSSLR
jgi:hypothetical protein